MSSPIERIPEEKQEEGRVKGGQTSGRMQAEQEGAGLASRIGEEGRVQGGQTSGSMQAEQEGAGLASRIPKEKKVEGGQQSGQSRSSPSSSSSS